MMNKSRKNTNRPAGGQGGGGGNITRSSPRPKGPLADGVYNNPHFLHAAALQMGNNVKVQTRGGIVVEGIFRAFSEDFSIALEVPHHYPIGAPDTKKINVDSVQENLIVKACDIVSIQAKDVDLDYATRDTFQTDTAISARLNGSLKFGGEKELQPWEGDTNGDFGVNFELDSNSNGWDANEMFSLNEKEHGIKTTFKDNLESYTVQIDQSIKNTDDFKEKEKKAARIAAEIEGNTNTRARLDLENGDEEAAFAAVVRPDDSNNNNDKNTPPPPNNNTQKYQPGQQKQSNRQPQDRKIPPQGGNKQIYSKSSAPMQPQPGAIQQTVNAVGFKSMTIQQHTAPQYQQPPPSHYASQQQQQQQNQNDNKNVNSNESNSNTNNKPVQQQQQRPVRMIPMNFNEPPPNMNPVSNQHMGKPPVMSVHLPPPQQQSHDPQTIHVHVPTPVILPPPGAAIVVPPPTVHAIHAQPPQHQRGPRGEMIRNPRNDDIRNLRQFQNDFNLAPAQVVQQQQQPQVPTTQDMNQIVEIKSGNVQHHPTPSSTPHSVIISEKAQTPPMAGATTPQLQTSNSNTSVNANNSSTNSNETTPPSSNDKPAKKFTLNPQAKPFTPRSPSTPTQSSQNSSNRPHTPQTPGPMVAQQPAQAQQIPPQPQQIAYYFTIPQQRPTPPPLQVRSNQKYHQFQVTQATGQPIFNPPVPPPAVMQYHPHPQQIPQPQTYQQTQLRMFDVQGQQHVAQYAIVQQPPTSTTPSPGHPQTVFHPQQQSQAGGPPQASFGHQQYVMLMPQYPPQQYAQQNPQAMHVVMPQQPTQHQSQ